MVFLVLVWHSHVHYFVNLTQDSRQSSTGNTDQQAGSTRWPFQIVRLSEIHSFFSEIKASLRRIPSAEPGERFGHPLSVTDFPNILILKNLHFYYLSPRTWKYFSHQVCDEEHEPWSWANCSFECSCASNLWPLAHRSRWTHSAEILPSKVYLQDGISFCKFRGSYTHLFSKNSLWRRARKPIGGAVPPLKTSLSTSQSHQGGCSRAKAYLM